MSWIHRDMIIRRSDYDDPSEEYEKEALELMENLGRQLNIVDEICKQLRYYALRETWPDGKGTSTNAVFEKFHYIKDKYDEIRESVFGWLNFPPIKTEVIKLKKGIIKEIERKEK